MTATTTGISAYWHCLRDNKNYRMLWIAEVIDNIGSWLNYVATLELVEQYSGGSGLAISGVVLIRFIPSLLLCPIAGVVADRCNRLSTIIIAALLDAILVAALVFIQDPSQLAIFFLLLFGQFAAIALNDPAKKAIIPVLVPRDQLHVASTLDTFAWSITGAIGASTGGLISSKLGTASCFLLDAVTYMLAAYCAYQIPYHLGDPHALDTSSSNSNNRAAADEIELAAAVLSDHDQQQLHPRHPHHDTDTNGSDGLKATAKTTTATMNNKKKRSTLEEGIEAFKEGLLAIVEGWRYLNNPNNRDLLYLVCLKACGSISWGAVDVLNVKFSEMPEMQTAGMDSATTLGVIFGMVGFGCFIGPILLNTFVPPNPRPLIWACVMAFTLLFLGYTLMLIATHISVLLISTFVRAIGSSALWVYSSLLMQLRVPNSILGRMSAVEMALYTIAEAFSSIFAGAAFDILGLSLKGTLAVLCLVSGLVVGAWLVYCCSTSITSEQPVVVGMDSDKEEEREALVAV